MVETAQTPGVDFLGPLPTKPHSNGFVQAWFGGTCLDCFLYLFIMFLGGRSKKCGLWKKTGFRQKETEHHKQHFPMMWVSTPKRVPSTKKTPPNGCGSKPMGSHFGVGGFTTHVSLFPWGFSGVII